MFFLSFGLFFFEFWGFGFWGLGFRRLGLFLGFRGDMGLFC